MKVIMKASALIGQCDKHVDQISISAAFQGTR